MNPPRANDDDYLDFIAASLFSFSSVEAARVQPERANKPAHDAFSRLLQRLEPDSEMLWQEARHQVAPQKGVLIVDDSTLDKPYATKMELVSLHWSGKHRRVVQGINLQTLLWSDGERYIPCDYRIYHMQGDGLTRNEHFRTMVQTAYQRGFAPAYLLFDIWYSALDNLKLVRSLGWHFFTQLKANRMVNPDGTGNRQLESCAISAEGTVVHLKGFGFVKVFRIVVPHDNTRGARPERIEYWATSHLEMDELTRLRLTENAFAIEHYHRGLKQYCGVEKGQMRSARRQRNYIGLCIRAFLRLESYCYPRGLSWHWAKLAIHRPAVTAYLQNPFMRVSTA
jgi:hypothetical protein